MATDLEPKIIIIFGPTASGKSDLAVSLARKFSGEIISADSRQVYKGLDIGTGKITKKEMKGIPHYLLNIVSPQKQFSVSAFKKIAENIIEKILKKGKLPIVCGGTAHYISVLLGQQQIPEVPPNLKLRKKLEKKSVAELFEMLKDKDPQRSAEIDSLNKRRLVRALEIARKLGKVPKEKIVSSKYQVLRIGIKIPNEILREKIEKRIDKWFKQGLLGEVKSLHKKGLSWKRMSEIGLEYRLVAEYLSKKTFDIAILKKKMKEKTWQYAKRQMMWWKRDNDIKWFTPTDKQIGKEINKFLKN